MYFLFQPLGTPHALALLRIGVGLAVLCDTIHWYWRGEFAAYFGVDGQNVRLSYEGLELLSQMAQNGVWMTHCFPCILFVSSACVCLGLVYRYASIVLAISYAFVFLCEASRYVNHYWLYLWLCVLLAVSRASCCLSLDTVIFPQKKEDDRVAENWNLLLPKLQISIVYFFAAVAKCNVDGLRWGEPIRSYLRFAQSKSLQGLHNNEFLVFSMVYGSIAIDLLLPLMLWNQRWKYIALPCLISFHTINHFIFGVTIGSFPFLALFSTLSLFFAQEVENGFRALGSLFATRVRTKGVSTTHPPKRMRAAKGLRSRTGLYRQKRTKHEFGSPPSTLATPSQTPLTLKQQLLLLVIVAYLSIHLLLPLRHVCMTEDISWTQLGALFSWRMMAVSQDGWVRAVLNDTTSSQLLSITPRDGHVRLSENAISNLILHPFLVRHWIWHEINARNQLRGAQAYKLVYLDTWKSINSRPYQQWIDATISTKLLDEDFSWSDRSFANRIQTFDSPEWRQVIKGSAAAWQTYGFRTEHFMGNHHDVLVDRVIAGHQSEALLIVLHGEVAYSSCHTSSACDYRLLQPNYTVLMEQTPSLRTLQVGEKAFSLPVGRWFSLYVRAEHGTQALWMYAIR